MCACVCFIFSSSHLSLKNPHQNVTLMPFFWKNPTPCSWFYEFPFGCCSDGPLCLKPALQQDGGDVAESALPRLGPLLLLFLTLVFFVVVFFTITNTKDPVEKTFCFTGNKKIIYASVKCNLLPLFIHPNQASLEFTETNRKQTGDFCIFIHPCGEWNERTVPTDRTQLLCTTFQVLMNKRWNWQ